MIEFNEGIKADTIERKHYIEHIHELLLRENRLQFHSYMIKTCTHI